LILPTLMPTIVPQTVAEIWPGYLAEGYFDSTRNLRLELVRRVTVDPLAAALAGAGLTKTQLRRFFQHCRGLEVQLRAGQASWENLAAKFALIDASAEAALRRSQAAIPPLFYDFLITNCAAVGTRADFLEGFIPHYVALIGFSAAHLRE
jgi:hypothetical protein